MPFSAIDEEDCDDTEFLMLANDLRAQYHYQGVSNKPTIDENHHQPNCQRLDTTSIYTTSLPPACDTLKKTAFRTSLTSSQRKKIERYLARQMSRHAGEIRNELKKIRAKMKPSRATFSKKSFCEIQGVGTIYQGKHIL